MMRDDEMAQAAGAASPEHRLAGSLRRAMIASDLRRGPLPARIEQSASARPNGFDQLAKLARLIEQDATLTAIVRGAQAERPAELTPPQETPPFSHLTRADKAFEHGAESEAGSASVNPGLCEGPAGGPHGPPEYGEYDGPDYSNGLPDRGRGLRVFAVFIGLALAGSASGLAYWALSHERGRSDEARVMAASISPDKTAPSPREDSRVDERVRDQSDERSVNATGRTTTGAEEPADARPSMPQAPPPTSVVFGPIPTKLAELTPAPTPPGRPADAAQNHPPDVTKPAPRQSASGAPEPSGADDARHVVQLSSERDEAAAHAQSRVLQTKFRDAFAGRKPFIRRADLGDRGIYYRVQVGPFSMGEANQICESLKKSGADCVVHRN